MSAVGIKNAGDFNSGSILGSQWFPVTAVPRSQNRASSQNIYLSALDASNLTVYTSTMGKKINFDNQKKAVAVEVQTQGNLYTLRVKQEVIVSAGAFQSPQRAHAQWETPMHRILKRLWTRKQESLV